jgi:hypothetical protein
MPRSTDQIPAYLEIGQKKTFAAALDWPGWCRSGRDEASALETLLAAGERYARLLHAAKLEFQPPADVSAFKIVERLVGNATTDFGSPGMIPSADSDPVSGADLERFQELLKAYWRAFDRARQSAAGRELRKGPRGGGRETDAIIRHVLEGDQAYLANIGWKLRVNERDHVETKLDQTRQAILEGLAASAGGELPARGPRGGIYWTPRYFVRRIAWHVLDHAWEIEDRVI